MPCIPIDKRTESFKEVELGYNEVAAMAEAKRCLRCDLEVKEE
jgi:NADPH-dependent glutamate synthase beta subunit-like oxidoreductase